MKNVEAENYEGEEYDYSDDGDGDGDGDYDEDDACDEMSGLACPFCSEDFDVLGLCCHIDVEHLKEAKASVILSTLCVALLLCFRFYLGKTWSAKTLVSWWRLERLNIWNLW